MSNTSTEGQPPKAKIRIKKNGANVMDTKHSGNPINTGDIKNPLSIMTTMDNNSIQGTHNTMNNTVTCNGNTITVTHNHQVTNIINPNPGYFDVSIFLEHCCTKGTNDSKQSLNDFHAYYQKLCPPELLFYMKLNFKKHIELLGVIVKPDYKGKFHVYGYVNDIPTKEVYEDFIKEAKELGNAARTSSLIVSMALKHNIYETLDTWPGLLELLNNTKKLSTSVDKFFNQSNEQARTNLEMRDHIVKLMARIVNIEKLLTQKEEEEANRREDFIVDAITIYIANRSAGMTKIDEAMLTLGFNKETMIAMRQRIVTNIARSEKIYDAEKKKMDRKADEAKAKWLRDGKHK